MGFHLNCLFTVDRPAIALYERLVPGGSRWAVPTEGEDLPSGWVLPLPWDLEFLHGEAVRMVESWTDPAEVDAWRRAAGVPDRPDPLKAFDDGTLQLTSLLSLAGPSGVVHINDQTFGGTLFNEYAAVFVDGRLRAASGIDFPEDRAFELRDGGYRPADRAAVSPVADCAAVLAERFRGAFLFGGYLPRDAHDWDQGPPVTAAAPTAPAWVPYFPLLAR